MTRPFEGRRALLADDYETVRRMLGEALRSLGFAVEEAADGAAALERLRRERFDILFTDLVMPELDGFELCEEVRKTPELQNLPVVVVSTHCDADYVMKALRLGADDYITKPIEPRLLERVIRRALTPTLPVEAAP
jgi:CheY-like chemotaxis protein